MNTPFLMSFPVVNRSVTVFIFFGRSDAFRRVEDAVEEFKVNYIKCADGVGMALGVFEEFDGVDETHGRLRGVGWLGWIDEVQCK